MQFTLKQTIGASDAFLFDLTEDYRLRPQWDTLFKRKQWLTPAPIGKGSRLRYTTYTGMSMLVEYRAYHPPKTVSIEMAGNNFWLSQFGGGWRFNRLGSHLTEVVFTYGFKAKRFPRLIEPLFARLFAWENRRRLKKLKTFAEQRYAKQNHCKNGTRA